MTQDMIKMIGKNKMINNRGANLLRYTLVLLLMTFGGGVNGAWGQEGVWYIANDNTSNGHPGKVWSEASDDAKYYLVPAANPQQTNAIDAYYSPNHNTTNGDSEKPFLATAQTNKDLNSIWIVKESGESGFYFIIHAFTGKYVIYEVPLPNDPNKSNDADETKNGKRKTMHLQTIDNGGYNPSTNDNFKFAITTSGGGYNIRPKRRSGWFWNPAGQNNDVYYGQSSGENPNLYRNGLVGVFNNTGTNSIWHFEDASSATTLTPVISDVDGTNNTFTITSPAAAFSTIHYTIDGNTQPDANTGTSIASGSSIPITDNWTVKAVGVFGSYITPMAGPKSLSPTSCITPVITYSNGEATITTDTEDATIYYTTDVTDPTTGSTPYSSAIPVSDGMTIKAIATNSELPNSSIASLTIVLTPTITIGGAPFTYNGTEQEPTVTVKKGETVIDPSEYTISYSNNINAGSSATVTITDNEGGDYYVAGSTTFTISPMSIGSGNDPVSGITIDVSESGGSYSVTVKHGENTLTQGTDYTWTGTAVGDDYEVTVTGIGNYTGTAKGILPAITPGYYVLHQDGKGYLKVGGANVSLSNDGTFQSGDLFSNNGNCIWYITPEGYLQNEYFYLNVANGRTLYLDVKPVTKWKTEDISGDAHDKKHIKINVGGSDYYLCNDGTNITLSTSTSAYYNACPVTVTEVEESWSAPTADDLTIQSPQLVTYLRAYFKQKIKYEFYNDKGETVASTDGKHERRVYAKLEYASGGSNKGTDWDITPSGIIYNLKASGDVTVKANYDILPADPGAKALHPTAVLKNDVTYIIQQKAFAPDVSKKYLLFNTQESNYRFPHAGSASENDFLPVDGKQSDLTVDPNNDDLSWIIEADAEGFYSFKNAKTNNYIYYDAVDYTLSDFGAVKIGATTLPADDTRYKFRLFSGVSRTGFTGKLYYIIPYDKQFAVYNSSGVLGELYFAIYVNKTPTPKIGSLYKASDNAKWQIYLHEWEYRLWDDYAINGDQNIYTADEHEYTATTWFSRNIKGSRANTDDCTLPGSKTKDGITYIWEISGPISSYVTTEDVLASGTSTLTITPTLPSATRTGTLKVTAKITTPANKSNNKTIQLTLYNLNPSFTDITSLSQIIDENGLYRLTTDISYSSTNKPAVTTFSGTLTATAKEDGTYPVISNLTQPLFTTVTGATINNIMIKGGATAITADGGPVGAICGTADGSTKIYNCGILSGIVSGSTYVGGIVGELKGNARVINCYSFAEVRGGTVAAGIVGCISTKVSTASNINSESIDIAINQSTVTSAPMVMNCMFYGDITSGTKKYPVYGGSTIRNDGAGSVNGYNYYRQNIYDKVAKDYIDDVTFDDDYSNVNRYNRSWPAEEQYLTRFEYYRSILNSNRRLCTWWVGGSSAGNGKAPNDADVEAVGIAKWVLDPEIAPYPVLKKWGKYPSVMNPDKTRVWDPRTKDADGSPLTPHWVNRSSAPAYQGKSYSTTFSVKINPGDHKASGLSEITKNDFVITDMDTLNCDYGYYKIQLPYYNEVFGIPDATDWVSKYGGNYTDYVVTGWEITKVSGGTQGTFVKTDAGDVKAWESGFNYADRYCTDKDIYTVGGRVFAQGGYYYVPEGVTGIEIKAHWGKAFYLHGKEHALDRVNVTNSKNYGTKFSPAGTLPTQITYNDGAEKTINIYDDFNTMMTEVKKNQSCTVYDQAVVLVGNYPLHAQNDIGLGNSGKGGFTIMSADFDMDNEPDFCLPLQWRNDLTRLPIMPVRFDFLPIPELGLAMRHNTYAYAIGIFVPQGHFEITETSFMHTTQFEYMSNNANVNMNHQQPLILNGGEFEQIVCHGNSKTPPSIGHTRNIIMGGHVWMRRFTPGSHSGQYAITRHCAISVMGGEFPEFYLTGLYWTGLTTSNAYNDSPHCYTNGGRFGIMAGAGMEAVKNSVFFEIDHSVIDEFYGGGINSNNPVAGDIHVTINNSIVNDIYCGGPKVGTCQTVTTNAKGTTFNRYFGGGNGGTNLYREGIQDATPNHMPNESEWRGSTYKFDNFKPITNLNTDATYNPKKGLHAEFEFEVFNQSNGLNNDAVARTYFHWAQFGVTETGNVTSILEDCTLKQNFYGGGNLATVNGTVTSTLKGTTTVAGSAFGAGFSATVPSFSVHDRTKPTFPTRDASGVCHNGKVAYLADAGTIRTYTWCYKNPTTNIVTPAGVEIPTSGINLTDNTDNQDYTDTKPVFQYNGEWYCLTKVPLDNLGTVTGDVTLNIEGNTNILGNVFGGGDQGEVEGSTEVNIEYEE